MQVVLRLLPVEYQEGFVIQRFRDRPIAESGILEVKSAAKLRETIDNFLAPYHSRVDAKLYVYGYGRKFSGFDKEAKFPRELQKAQQ